MEFSLAEVVKTKENFHFIEWDMRVTTPPESIDDYKFQIHWANDPASGFLPITDENEDPIEIDGSVGPLVYTHELRQYDFNKDYYYKILAILKAIPTTQFFSDVVFIGMYKNGIHEVMRYNESLLYKHFYGEPCYIIKRKSFGARCPVCWSTQRQQRVRTHCDTCHGTGFVTGYYQPIDIQISFDSDPKKSDSQKEWENVYDTKRARLSNYPMVRPKDLIVNKDDYKRYVIIHVETTKLPKLSEDANVLSKQNYILSQMLTLEELNPDDNEYFIDVDNIPPIPIEDEGQTGSTLPFFNDHKPVTVDPPLTVDTNQHVILHYSTDDFELVSGILKLKSSPGSIAVNNHIADVIIPTALKVLASNDIGHAVFADNTNVDQINRILGIGLSAAGSGGIVAVQSIGRLTYSGWNWDPGKSIFFDDDGDLTQIVPVEGFWKIVAQPITSTTIEIRLGHSVIKADL